MKSLKQSRRDRLARRIKQAKEKAKADSLITEDEKIEIENKFLWRLAEACVREGRRLCQHGQPFSGFKCIDCHPDEIAEEMREEWSPTPIFKLLVYGVDDSCLPVTVKTRGIAKKIMEMQNNGFWYTYKDKPIFMLPNSIKVIVVDDMVQNPDYIDQNPIDSTTIFDKIPRAPESSLEP
jgi:hypothetical protein